MRPVAQHPDRHVHRDAVPERPEALGDVERVIDPVPRRGGDREAHRPGQLGRLGLALGEGHDLVAQHGAGGDQTAAADRQSPSYSLRTVSAYGDGAHDGAHVVLLVRLDAWPSWCRRPARPRSTVSSVPSGTLGSTVASDSPRRSLAL